MSCLCSCRTAAPLKQLCTAVSRPSFHGRRAPFVCSRSLPRHAPLKQATWKLQAPGPSSETRIHLQTEGKCGVMRRRAGSGLCGARWAHKRGQPLVVKAGYSTASKGQTPRVPARASKRTWWQRSLNMHGRHRFTAPSLSGRFHDGLDCSAATIT